ncbi:uncharacterized protein LOC132699592 [Cylas formicarius]|uniref:uncharacterized protein LOC132699592 n=1 Tax=Cylas formicarius TaxID=197179 RepID=UPI00295865CB|nr:uncharacterized protein LOC132699592 [Cylas formicarius]
MFALAARNMKIPFHSVLGPVLTKNKMHINKICSHPIFGFVPVYVGALGIIGVVLSIFDIIRIIRCGSILPGYLWRERIKNGQFISPEVERDCKMISLVISTEYYLFLLVGLVTNNPVFYMPYLALYSLIITLEVIIFLTKVFVDGVDFKKCGLVMSLFMVFNWTSVFCTLARSTSCCDF